MYGGRSRNSPDNFQKELQSKMHDRRSKGLGADVTPSPSYGHHSEEELDSDDGTGY